MAEQQESPLVEPALVPHTGDFKSVIGTWGNWQDETDSRIFGVFLHPKTDPVEYAQHTANALGIFLTKVAEL